MSLTPAASRLWIGSRSLATSNESRSVRSYATTTACAPLPHKLVQSHTDDLYSY
jgi:hypothetical protein